MTGSSRIDLAAALDREWDQLASRPAAIERAHRWKLDTLPFDDLHQLLGLAGFAGLGRCCAAESNAVLRDLVEVARYDPLAGRVVLQRILPGLRGTCRRWRHGCVAAGVGPDELLGELVATAWIVICTYATDRRPRNVAHNLLSDTVHRSFVAPSRRRRAGERPHRPERFQSEPAGDDRPSLVELAELLREARQAGVAERHVTLLCDLLRAGGSAERVATDRGVTGRTIRSQRARAIARLRMVALAAA